MADIKPYTISVPDSAIQTLHAKLDLTTFPQETGFTDDWEFGAPLSDVQRLAKHWRNDFDWRAAEAKLNELPQFTTDVEIDGFGKLNIHFLHQRSSRPGSIPLLFCHGWPGSFMEVIKMLPLLTEPSAKDDVPSFHVVAPSLPNYGFSERVSKNGFGAPQYAQVMHKIMLKLGYDQYVTQGGDWGSLITRLMAVQFPSHCLAHHLNLILAPRPTLLGSPLQYLIHAVSPYGADEKAGFVRSKWFADEGYGYNLEQSTKPSTIGFALADSPVALLAWIYEKLHDWTDSYPWTDDEILTWISIYQFSRAGPAASARIYYEAVHAEKELTARAFGSYLAGVKLGLSTFPRDIHMVPRTWARTLGPVADEAWHSSGGHFAAHERPEELAGDLRRMFGPKGGAADVAARFATQ